MVLVLWPHVSDICFIGCSTEDTTDLQQNCTSTSLCPTPPSIPRVTRTRHKEIKGRGGGGIGRVRSGGKGDSGWGTGRSAKRASLGKKELATQHWSCMPCIDRKEKYSTDQSATAYMYTVYIRSTPSLCRESFVQFSLLRFLRVFIIFLSKHDLFYIPI